MASARARLCRLLVGLVGAGLALLVLSFAARATASAARIFGCHAGVAMTQSQLALAHEQAVARPRPRPIPRIIHQVWHGSANDSMPPDWAELRQSCLELHPTWEHKLWNESASCAFIQTEYPWFLDIYDGFRFPVQRVDTLRHFLLRHFGGIYIAPDNGCRASLEPLLYYPAWVADAGQGAPHAGQGAPLGSNVVGAEPEHPFWILVTDSLVSWTRDFVIPYVTVSYSTGRWYRTEMWQLYHSQKPHRDPGLIRVIMDRRPAADPWVFFTAGRGDPWDWNSHIGHISNHRFEAFRYGLASLGTLAAVVYAAGQAFRRRRRAADAGRWDRLQILE